MLNPVMPTPVKADKLGRSLPGLLSWRLQIRTIGAWVSVPQCSIQWLLWGVPVCVCGQLVIQGQQSPINMSGLCEGQHSGLFSLLASGLHLSHLCP